MPSTKRGWLPDPSTDAERTVGDVTTVAGAGALVVGVGGGRIFMDLAVFIAPVCAEDSEAVNKSGSMVIAEVASAAVVELNDPTTTGVADEDAGVDNPPDGPVPVLTAEKPETSKMYFQKGYTKIYKIKLSKEDH